MKFGFTLIKDIGLEPRAVTVSRAPRSDRSLGKSYLAPKLSSFFPVSEGLLNCIGKTLGRVAVNLQLVVVHCKSGFRESIHSLQRTENPSRSQF